MSIHRAKQPQAVRAQILQAAKQVLAEEGIGALTFDRVLARTDLSKGGVQHHFRTKQALLDGLFEHFMQEFLMGLHAALEQEPEGPHRRIRTYVSVVCAAAQSGVDAQEAIALLGADPKYQLVHGQLVRDFCGPDATAPDLSLTCQYAVDGIWHARVFGRWIDPEVVTGVRNCLFRVLDAEARDSCTPGADAPCRS